MVHSIAGARAVTLCTSVLSPSVELFFIATWYYLGTLVHVYVLG